jgi:flagellar basal-body rod protein FlgF
MDRLLYVSMTGANQVMKGQAVTAHNIANLSTTGFKASLQEAVGKEIEGVGLRSRVNVLSDHSQVDFAPGTLQATGRDLDVALRGNAWMVVQGSDGEEALTRRGDLQVDASGLVTTGAGHPVLGDGGPIAVPPNSKLTIGQDGTISVIPLGQTAAVQATVDRIRLVIPDTENLDRGADGLFRPREGEIPPPDAAAGLLSGHLETSNVNMAQAMVEMIELSRQFELHVKMMRTADDNGARAAELMRMS